MSEAGAHRRAGRDPEAAAAQTIADAASHTGSPRLDVSTEADVRPPVSDTERPQASLSPRAHARLTNLLIGKSIIETLFIGALAVLFLHGVLHPAFRGSVDGASAQEVWGWAVDEAAPGARVEVQLNIDGHFAGRGRADASRRDVSAAGRAQDEFHGFTLKPPPLPPGEHEARVYAVHESFDGRFFTLQQLDKPLRFTVPADAASETVPPDWWRATGQQH